MSRTWVDEIKFDAQGLVPAVIQDAVSKEVLMVAYMNREALLKTLRTGKAHFYSRSRRRIWLKGETSGHFQRVRGVALDCDGDTLLLKVTQTGGACHAGYRSCFYRRLDAERDWKVVGRKLFDPDKVYRGLTPKGQTPSGSRR
ncbi:MAG: phosphoribosyl-AMP cyclohydrolase [Candidatus Omnitrophica bacterium]|nr:phosphoribosyl-AMP cyclohydrolase [Candidatus Omnitrophota bacterium]